MQDYEIIFNFSEADIQQEMEFLKGIKRKQAKVKKSSGFIYPFDEKEYADKRCGTPLGASKINSTGRCMFGKSIGARNYLRYCSMVESESCKEKQETGKILVKSITLKK